MADGVRQPVLGLVSWLTAAPWRAFLLIFLVHVGFQAILPREVPPWYLLPHSPMEVPAAALALYERGELADPYTLPTGPTAHMPPFQPALMAAIYLLLGPTLAAGYATWLIAVGFYGIMYGMLPWLASRLGLRPEAGFVGGLVGALIPRWPGFAEALAAVAIGLMLAAFLRRWETRRGTSRGSFVLGLAIGVSFHVTPSLLPVALGLVTFELLWLQEPQRRRWAALTLLGMTLACVPWTWRNYTSLGGLLFIRSNFGLELRMGNHEGAGLTLEQSVRGGTERHPGSSEEEARKVQQFGELQYMRQAGREAVEWIRSHPATFLRLTGMRIVQFWFGPVDDRPFAIWISLVTLLSAVGAWRALPLLSVPQRVAILIPLVTYPLVYYLVGFEARYREPMDGLSLLLAATAFFAPFRLRMAAGALSMPVE